MDKTWIKFGRCGRPDPALTDEIGMDSGLYLEYIHMYFPLSSCLKYIGKFLGGKNKIATI